MARRRSHSIAFKRQVVSGVSAYETDWVSSRREDVWFIVALRHEDETDVRAGS